MGRVGCGESGESGECGESRESGGGIKATFRCE